MRRAYWHIGLMPTFSKSPTPRSGDPAPSPPDYFSEARLEDLVWDGAALGLALLGFTFAAPVGVVAGGIYVLSVYGLVHNGLFLFIDVALSDKDRAAIAPAKAYIGLVGRSIGGGLLVAGASTQDAERAAYRAQAISEIGLGFRDFSAMGGGSALFSSGVASAQWMKNEVDWAAPRSGGSGGEAQSVDSGAYYLRGWREQFDVEPYTDNDLY